MRIIRSTIKMAPALILLLLFTPTLKIFSQQTDPYFKELGGYGYSLINEVDMNVWWCEGAYKVMKDTDVPSRTGDTIRISSAKNEYEPFQVVLRSDKRVDNVRIRIENISHENNIIEAENIDIRQVEYLYVSKPTDSYGYRGWWPDPLPPLPDQLTLNIGENSVVWISVFIPKNATEGVYNGDLELSFHGRKVLIPLSLQVWDFSLPDTPSIKSGFGLSVDKISDYHNVTDIKDLRKAFDLYMDEFRKYRIAPYYPHALYPIKERVSGIDWAGGFFDSNTKRSGQYALRVEDNEPSEAISATTAEMIQVDEGEEYTLEWEAKSESDDNQYSVLIEGFDTEGDRCIFENRMETFKGEVNWKKYSYRIGPPGHNVSQISIKLFPALRTRGGENRGTVWFDNMVLLKGDNTQNLLKQGDFEIDPENVSISLDFTEFDIAASRYLDQFGFNSFRLDLKGMGSGTYYSRKEGNFAGFSQNSAEYKILMNGYLSQVEEHLSERGWLDKVYVYWFDEPDKRDYPFVRDGMNTIKGGAPGISTFLTENNPGPEIMDVTDITCTIWHKIDTARAKRVRESGQGYWSYLCTAPKYPWISEFIDHDAINLRIWLWGSFAYGLDGILIWSSNYWTSRDASPAGYLQNPWNESASFVQGYGWPYGKQTNWGNGDGRFFYPPNRNPNKDKSAYIASPVPSIRLEFLRQGIEDYEYFTLLKRVVMESDGMNTPLISEARNLLEIPQEIFTDGKTYTKNPIDLLEYRRRVAEMILRLNSEKTQ